MNIYKEILDENLDRGWITPEGWFYGCKVRDHMRLITHVLNVYPFDKPEQDGWIMVGSATFKGDGFEWVKMGHAAVNMTLDQERTLKLIGYNPDDNAKKRSARIKFSDVYPKGYADHPLPGDTVYELKKIWADLSARPEGLLHGLYPEPDLAMLEMTV